MSNFFITDDPVADAERYYEQLEEEYREWSESAPTCDDCEVKTGEVADYCYDIDGHIICKDCIDQYECDEELTNEVCTDCGLPLKDYVYYKIDGKLFCENCLYDRRKELI